MSISFPEQKRRREVAALEGLLAQPAPLPPPMQRGTVKAFEEERGFGFIKPDHPGKDYFFHATALKAKTINAGQRVEFDVETTERGERAVNVKPVFVLRM